MRQQNPGCGPFDLLRQRTRPPCQTGRMAMSVIQILVYAFPLLPASSKENSPPSTHHSTCPGHHYLMQILGTVLLLPQTLHALSPQKLHRLLARRLPRILYQLFRCPLIIPLPHRPFATLPHSFRPINHGGSLALVTPFTSLLRMSHLVWLCTSRPPHLGLYLRRQPWMLVQ